MLGIVLCALVAIALLAVYIPGKPYWIIPFLIIFLIFFMSELNPEKFYNPKERSLELSEAKKDYEQYIQALKSTLNSCGIDSAQKRKVLKAECQTNLDKLAKPYNTISSNAYNMLIGVPLGAIVSSIIYKNEGDTVVIQIVFVILIGLCIIVFSKFIKYLCYFAEGHFKDRYLLESIHDYQY